MRKLLLLTITILFCIPGFAQKSAHNHPYQLLNSFSSSENILHTNGAAKTSGIGDTAVLSNIPAADSAFVLYTEGTNDSNGYLTGTDSSNDHAFAERYDFNSNDSSVIVIGVMAQFGGTVNPASVQTINFNVWDQDYPEVLTATLSYSGFPLDILDSLNVPVTQLGIGATTDTMKAYFFRTPTGLLQTSFFVGYSINYNFTTLNGDTIGLASSMNGDRNSVAYTPYVNTTTLVTPLGDSTVTTLDTVINAQNATMQSDNNWYDNYTQNDSLFNDLAVFPIVVIESPTGASSITKNDLTFFGNYPNPASNSTNIKFSLATNTDVTIRVMDMAGHTLNTITQSNMGAGAHIIPVNTTDMSAGSYLYLIRTSNGAGIASKLAIVK